MGRLISPYVLQSIPFVGMILISLTSYIFNLSYHVFVLAALSLTSSSFLFGLSGIPFAVFGLNLRFYYRLPIFVGQLAYWF